MKLKLGVIMDPIGSINFKKDSTLAMLLEAQSRDYTLYYIEQQHLFAVNNQAMATAQPVQVFENPDQWYELGPQQTIALAELDVILMRKDPPFDMDYIYTTYLLELAEAAGTLVVNRAQSLRDANEKFFTTQFPQCISPTLVSAQAETLHAFVKEHQDTILKPLDGMGGASIYRVKQNDPNINVIFENLTQHGQRLIMAQKFIPEISAGDKRILLINGEAVPYALARIPAKGETRANLAAGGEGVVVELTERDHWICRQVAPTLIDKGLMFVGIDVIGDYLTEVNVTSPTCIREIDQAQGLNISAQLMDCIERTIEEKQH
ncbi:MAG: glutathione synthase [Gammaproteobacteria bacterium]|nr:glutathione synthase [Gammaproteobacteria bacterium]MDH5776666.1 glutathione synthase [Gammaproteobacteria bacterium]